MTPAEARALIAKAVEDGRVTRVPAGVSAIVRKPKKDDAPVRFHPEHCGNGGKVSRHNFIDELDGDWS